MGRLFTFGCSMTKYHYPTWADIVGSTFDTYENWGKPSAGNLYILNSLVECHLKNNFVESDTIYIMWSGLARIDYFQIDEWKCMHNEYYDLKTNLPFSCPLGYEYISFGFMTAAIHVLENLNVNWKMWCWQEIDTDTDSYNLYKKTLNSITPAHFPKNKKKYPLNSRFKRSAKLLYSKIAGPDWPPLNSIIDGSYKSKNYTSFINEEINEFLTTLNADKSISSSVYKQYDGHPSPISHLKWVNSEFPNLNIPKSTIELIHHIDKCLLDNKDYNF